MPFSKIEIYEKFLNQDEVWFQVGQSVIINIANRKWKTILQ